MVIQEEKLSEQQLNENFMEALEKGYEIFGVWAIFGLSNIENFNIYKILNLMKKKGLVFVQDDKLYLTDKGKQQYHNALSQEIKRVSKDKNKYKNWKPPSRFSKLIWILIGIVVPITLILFEIYVGPIIYDFIINLIK